MAAGKAQKRWLVSYSIRYIDGKTVEQEATFNAKSIQEALDKAKRCIVDTTMQAPEVSQVAIWSVGIIDEDVFQGDQKPD